MTIAANSFMGVTSLFIHRCRQRSGRTRYSIDFRAVNANDVATQHGAVKVDSDCTGSTMGDYLRCSDLSHLPRDLMLPYEMGPPPSQMSH